MRKLCEMHFCSQTAQLVAMLAVVSTRASNFGAQRFRSQRKIYLISEKFFASPHIEMNQAFVLASRLIKDGSVIHICIKQSKGQTVNDEFVTASRLPIKGKSFNPSLHQDVFMILMERSAARNAIHLS